MSISKLNRIAIRRGIVYEGDDHQLWAIYPKPLVVNAEFSLLECYSNNRGHMIFVEDSFDLSNKIRRGRFFSLVENFSKWQSLNVENGLYGKLVGINGDGKFDCEASGAYAYVSDIELAKKEKIILGSNKFSTTWKIIDVEENLFGQQVFTIQSENS